MSVSSNEIAIIYKKIKDLLSKPQVADVNKLKFENNLQILK
jgi:hypothetical protein